MPHSLKQMEMLLGVTPHLVFNSSEAAKALLLEMITSKAAPVQATVKEESGLSSSDRKGKRKINPLLDSLRSRRPTRSQTAATVCTSSPSLSPPISPLLAVKLETGSSAGQSEPVTTSVHQEKETSAAAPSSSPVSNLAEVESRIMAYVKVELRTMTRKLNLFELFDIQRQ